MALVAAPLLARGLVGSLHRICNRAALSTSNISYASQQKEKHDDHGHGHDAPQMDPHKGKIASDAVTMPDLLGHAVGPERWELLANLAGDSDPYQLTVQKRGKAVFDEPSLVPSVFDRRTVGCVCHDEATHINWMTLHKGIPQRCECGYWFKLVELKPVDYTTHMK